MKTIKKIISLENSKSRVPGLMPSLINNEFVKYDEKSLETMYNGNYGLIVSDIQIPTTFVNKITDYTDIYVNIKKGDDNFYLIEPYKKNSEYYIENNNIYHNGNVEKYLSYYTLNKWYHFFEEYSDLLNVDTCDNPRKYESATEYYENEIENKSEEQEEYYKSLDTLFDSRGGKDFYDWITLNCIFKYEIPIEYRDGWNTTYLYYPELIKWKAWFSERNDKYSGVTDCSTTLDCCDCEEYFKRGGKDFYDWITLNCIFKYDMTLDTYDFETASITIPINITTTIDIIGETSTFAEEWEAGENYHRYNGADYNMEYANGTTTGGTLAIYNQDVMVLKDNDSYSGFSYDKDYKEIFFPIEQWETYYKNDGTTVSIISGITDSKLTTLKDFKKAFDDVGNELPGLFEIKQANGGTLMSQPKEGDTLDLYYKVGNINNLSQMKDENNEPIENSFWGDIITNMEFFYYYYDGLTKVEDTRVRVSGETSNLKAIEDCIKKHEEQLKNDVIMEEKMSCEITYILGAKLKQDVVTGDTNVYKGYLIDENSGIKYTDIVKIIKNETIYYLTKTDGYPIFYYDMEYELNDVILNEYENKELTTNRTNFIIEKYENKGFISAPTIREEYKFGTVMKPKIKRDVYIDRGLNKAIDKHLKLGEISSFEALENYNNGFFNIINNNL